MKDWNELSMKERAAFIKTGVANGLRSIDDIQKNYEEYASGGPLTNILLKPFSYQQVPQVRFATGGGLNTDEDSNTPTKEQIINLAWEAENPNNRGLKDGKYSKYPDPSGKEDSKGNPLYNVGPGLLVGVTIPDRDSYEKQELNDSTYSYGLKSLESIGKSFDEYYGKGEFNKVDPTFKLLMNDVRYRTGRLSRNKFPKLYQAVHDRDTVKALQESRTTFIDKNGNKVPDNDRVRRLAEFLYPGVFNVTYNDNGIYITRKKKN